MLDKLHEYFEYRNGNLYWKISRGSAKQGNLVGNLDKEGYRKVLLRPKSYRVHNLIWAYHYGYLPKQLDHIDGNPQNNAIENLRLATSAQNNANRGKHKRNTTGFKGVTWVKACHKYSARLAINKSRLFLGYFSSPEQAHLAYVEAVNKHCGEFGRIN
jgi:hypothetical protein